MVIYHGAFHKIRIEIKYLILVKLTIFICGLAFVLKGDDDETNKYINHKKGNDNNINEIKAGHNWSVVVYRTMVFFIRINGNIEDAKIEYSAILIVSKNVRY